MHTYEIRTFEHRRHSSLIMFALCPNDLTAIVMARDFIRRGQEIEVWQRERLVYRVGAKPQQQKPLKDSGAFGPQRWRLMKRRTL